MPKTWRPHFFGPAHFIVQKVTTCTMVTPDECDNVDKADKMSDKFETSIGPIEALMHLNK